VFERSKTKSDLSGEAIAIGELKEYMYWKLAHRQLEGSTWKTK